MEKKSLKRIQDSQRNICIEIEKLSNHPFYSMHYYGDDCFEAYLLRGAHSLEDYCAFIDTALIRNRDNPIRTITSGVVPLLHKIETVTFYLPGIWTVNMQSQCYWN